MNGYNYTRVWNIDKKLVVANTIEEAIRVIKLYHKNDNFYEPRSVIAVSNDSMVEDYDAIIESK